MEPRTLVSATTRAQRTPKRTPRRKSTAAKTAVAAETTQAAASRRKATVSDDPVAQAAARLGIEQLHAEQEEAISHMLQGHDVLMILPTGFGKSACYQIPSMVMKKPVLVISPLLALLKDQHEKLATRDIPVVRLDGTVRGKARREPSSALPRVARS